MSQEVRMYFAGGAVMASRKKPPTSVDINVFHCSYAYASEKLLTVTAQKLGITLTGTLEPCMWCSMAKRLCTTVYETAATRAKKEAR